MKFSLMVAADQQERLEETLAPFQEVYTSTNPYVRFYRCEVAESQWQSQMTTIETKDGEILDPFDDRLYRELTSQELTQFGSDANFIEQINQSWHSRQNLYRVKKWDSDSNLSIRIRIGDNELTDYGFRICERPAKEVFGNNKALFAEQHHCVLHNGKLGRWENPDARWSSFQVGGQFSGYLISKEGYRANTLKKGDINPEAIITEHLNARIPTYHSVQHLLKLYPDFKTWEKIVACTEPALINQARLKYFAQPAVKTFTSPFSDDSIDNYCVPYESFVKNDAEKAIPYALLHNGVWVDRHDDETSWYNRFLSAFELIEPNKIVTILDCHL